MENFIKKTIDEYYGKIKDNKNARFLSWEHCYGFFYSNKEKLVLCSKNNNSEAEELFDYAALMLFAYLASWGMLRNSFLMNYDYKIHIGLIKDLVNECSELWIDDFTKFDEKWNEINGAKEKIIKYYEPFKNKEIENAENVIKNSNKNYKGKDNNHNNFFSDILITKILLGIFGCVPAYDNYFKKALGAGFNNDSYEKLINFYTANKDLFPNYTLKYYPKIEYPPMKLIDMFFWQTGKEIIKLEKENKQEELKKIKDDLNDLIEQV